MDFLEAVLSPLFERINRNNTEDKSRSIGFSVSLRTIGDFGTSTSGGLASFN